LVFPNYKTFPFVVEWDSEFPVERSPLTVKHSETQMPPTVKDKTEEHALGKEPFTSLR